MEKLRVTEIQVRMDCNGCVQKIKKALHGINGICELYIDFPQQKITIIGWADPEKIAKAIKKTRKTAIICSHTEPPDDHPQQAQPPDDNSADAARGDGPPANPPPQHESANPGPTEDGSPGQQEAHQPGEPPKDPPQHPKSEAKPKSRPKSPAPAADEVAEASSPGKSTQTQLPAGSKEVEEVHVVYHHPPDYGFRYDYHDPGSMDQGYNGQWHSYRPPNPGFRPEPPQQPMYVTHSYNTYRTSPYVTGYQYITPPTASKSPSPQYIHYSRPMPPPEYTHYSTPPPPPPPPVASTSPSPQCIHYSRPTPPPEYTHYSMPPPPPPPPQYIYYSRPTPPPEFTHYSRPPPPTQYTQYSYSRPEGYSNEDYHYYGNSGNGNGNITSAFSDENPNACRIV